MAQPVHQEPEQREHAETEREAVLAARLDALNEFFQQSTASLDLESMLQAIVHAACRLRTADIAAISLFDENRVEAYVAA